MILYHTVKLRGGRVIYIPTSISKALMEFAPKERLITDKELATIRFKNIVSSLSKDSLNE
jgi:hypothetical protein